MKFKWLNASKILVFGGLKNHRTPVRLSSTVYITYGGKSGKFMLRAFKVNLVQADKKVHRKPPQVIYTNR
jgi:hypothetical protein